jgi:predicted metal-dependent peptidase
VNKTEGTSKEEFFKALDDFVELDEKAKKYSLSRDVLALLHDEPFFACVSRFVTKRRTTSIPTAAIYIDKRTFRPVMLYNPRFMVALPPKHRAGILKHEYYHLILNHITQNRMDFNKKNQKIWNVAMDLAINSFLMEELPEFALFPGRGIFEKLPAEKSAEWYKQAILSDPEILEELGLDENGEPKPCDNCGGSGQVGGKGSPGQGSPGGKDGAEGSEEGEDSEGGHQHGESGKECGCDEESSCSHNPSSGQGGGGNVKPCPCCNNHGFDDHSMWDDLTEEEQNIVEKKLRRVLSDAVYESKRTNSKGWGTVHHQVQGWLEKLLQNKLNWKGILRMFVQASIKAERYSTIKKINKRYRWTHPGKSRRRSANIAVAIDQSGSVGDGLLMKFFAELNSLSKLVTFTVIPFDHEVFVEKIFKWKKGQNRPPERVLSGGTCFTAPTKYCNENGPFDGLIILTDMEAPAPIKARMQRMWITSASCAEHMYFKPPTETVLIIPEDD